MIPLDENLRPRWLFDHDRARRLRSRRLLRAGQFTKEYGIVQCLVKLGCWGPVVKCNVPKRGWMAGIGGCPNVGGICIGCTMPGFPDMFMPFMDEPPGAKISSRTVGVYGAVVRSLALDDAVDAGKRNRSGATAAPTLTTGYRPTW